MAGRDDAARGRNGETAMAFGPQTHRYTPRPKRARRVGIVPFISTADRKGFPLCYSGLE
jgi:hypothetical protein